MSTYQKLVDRHSPLGIYNIINRNNISYELRAYAKGLDMLNDAIKELEEECFISTAKGYGLKRRELMFGAVRDDLSYEARRNMLLKRYAFGEGDFTIDGVIKVLELLGIQGSIQEYPTLQRITITVENEDLPKGQRNWILSQMNALFPAHIEVDAVFGGFSWADSEQKNLTFQEMDNLRKTWYEIDYYC